MKKILIILLTTFVVSACTGTRVSVSPDSSTINIEDNSTQRFTSIGIRELPPEMHLPVAGDMTKDFISYLTKSDKTTKIYYPLRPDDSVDIILETQFSSSADSNSGSTFVKSLLTGFSLFLLEPVFWYNIDYHMTGTVNAIKNDEIIDTISASSDSSIGMKWLSLSQGQSLEGEALLKAKESLYKQIIQLLAENKTLSKNSE